MNLLNEMMAADAAFLMADDGFAEAVIYTPRNGTARTINAIVDRNPPALATSPGDPMPLMTVSVANNATTGISSAELDVGGDTITVAYRIGRTAKSYQIHLPDGVTHDRAILNLELR